jgi:hypothetical protein
MQYIKLQHELIHARYDEITAKWHLRFHQPTASRDSMTNSHYEEIEDTADVLFTGLGGLSRWTWPDIPGFNEFKGPISHSARWDKCLTDWGEKKVGVVGVVRLCLELVAWEPCAPTHDSLPYVDCFILFWSPFDSSRAPPLSR